MEAYINRADPETTVKAMVDCLRCSKKLSNKQSLRRHCHDVHRMNLDLTPIEVQTFPCPDSSCVGKSFKRRSHLYVHMKAVHNGKSRGGGRRIIYTSEAPQISTQKQQLSPFINLEAYPNGGYPPQNFSIDTAPDFPNINRAESSLELANHLQTHEGSSDYGLDPAVLGMWEANLTEPEIIDASEFLLYPDCVFYKQTNSWDSGRRV